jgi:hypothetical protein
MIGKNWVRHRARADIFNISESLLFKSSRQRQVFALSQSPKSHLISDDIDMSDIREGDTSFSYI